MLLEKAAMKKRRADGVQIQLKHAAAIKISTD